MCGIVGVLRYGTLGNEDDRNSALYLATTLLELTESRGKDATGVVSLFDDGNFFGQKMAVRSSEFITRFGGTDSDFDGLQTVLRDYKKSHLRTIIGHCRKKSVGGAFDNVNNHPIKVNNIIGVHNGTLRNHDIIFKNLKCKRDGTVDSEAIFSLLNYYTKNCKEPFTLEMLVEVTKRLEGSFSILAFNANNPNQLVSARDGRPAEYCLVRPLKMILIGSEEKIIDAALWNYNKLAWNHNINGFKKLRASDIDRKTLSDDTIALFDMTREITPTTEISSLYDTISIPRSIDRIWKVPFQSSIYSNRFRAAGYGHAGYNTSISSATKTNKNKSDKQIKTTKDNTTCKSKSNNKKKVLGLAWNPKLESYVKVFTKESRLKGNVVIDVERKQCMSLRDAVNVTKKDNEELITIPPQKQKEHNKKNQEEHDDGLDKKVEFVERYTKNKTVKITTVKPIEAGTHKDPSSEIVTTALAAIKAGAKEGKELLSNKVKATKASIEAIKSLKRYTDLAEIATLCNTTENNLKKLPVTALTNRLIKSHFKEIFVAGYLAHCDEITSSKQSNKLSNAKRHIRVLKGVTKLLDGIMSEEISRDKARQWMDLWINAGVSKEITSDSLKEVFNPGDLRDNKVIRTMVSILDNTITT